MDKQTNKLLLFVIKQTNKLEPIELQVHCEQWSVYTLSTSATAASSTSANFHF